ncbi:MAG: CcoQ/FixQ family Cbb3-type cytochrome c oxidase assembly chaperone [Burkholderiaceae bacterium]|nr:CcoQ/FixQ family Cbb3-type cytochrome c oxidase assembly chaperone [Burkholderiaceae bacterium]
MIVDQNDLRVAITVLTLIVFIGIVLWAYSARQKHRFDEAANLPFADDDAVQRLTGEKRNG